MTSCPSLDWVAAWALGELAEADSEAFEEHYFGCEQCSARARRMHETIDLVSRGLPIALTPARRSRAERDSRLVTVRVDPGQHAVMNVGSEHPYGIWVLRAPVAGARKVDVDARSTSGAPIFSVADAPFDEQRGEVVLLCSSHYRGIDSQLHTRVTATDASGAQTVTEYVLDHNFL
jgi:hypothetical protein